MTVATDEPSTMFAALADPTRRAILERLRTGEATLGELAGQFEMSVQPVGLHLKVPMSIPAQTQGSQRQ